MRAGRALACLVLAVGMTAVAAEAPAQEVWPETAWPSATPNTAGMDRTLLDQGIAYAKQYKGSGMVVRGGKRIRYWGDQARLWQLYSATKTIGGMMLGLGIGDDKAGLADLVQPVIPDFTVPPVPAANNAAALLPGITLGQLATHTAGFAKTSGFGGLLFAPGTAWSYSDGGANWVADYLTLRFGQDLDVILRARLLDRLQIPVTALTWRPNSNRPRAYGTIPRREFGAGISANVDALARLGLMLLRDGRWKSEQLLPAGYVGAVLARPTAAAKLLERFGTSIDPEAPRHYGTLAWNNADGWLQGVPTDAFWAWGLNEQLILVVPSLDLVVARVGPRMGSTGFGEIERLAPFLGPIARSVRRANAAPVVEAGPDLARHGPGSIVLDASVREDGLPGTTRMTIAWRQVSGPAPAAIQHPGRLATAVTLPAAGIYVLELAVGDGALTGIDSVTVTVN